MEGNTAKKHWYDSTALVIILTIILFPVGLYGLYKNTVLQTKTKWTIFAVFAVLLIIGALSDKNETTSPTTPTKATISFKYLSVTRGEVLSVYSPQPDKIGSENTAEGTTIDSYPGKFHTLELETHNGQLIRASLKYNILNMKADTNAGLSFVLFARIFSQKIAGIVLGNDQSEIDKLGLNDAYSPGPDELIHNGVKLRRYTKGGVLIFEAIAD